ncbi:MAG TPA: hypothetical protein VFQ39_03375 [Longimicrobium sp.]|nr:hypothetical protein [Longimicrobium sp.]
MVSDTALYTIHWSDLVGGGLVGSVLLLALVERLRRIFATRADLNGLGDRVNTLQGAQTQIREALDEARERLSMVETEQKHQLERVTAQVIRPLERITEKLENVMEAQAAQAASLEHIVKRLDRLDVRKGGNA